MSVMGLLFWLLIGAIAGWLAGELMRGRGFGVIGNIIVGIVGALVGGFLFDVLGLAPNAGMVGSLITATIGAIVLLFLVGMLRGAAA